MSTKKTYRCSFCGKSQYQVSRLIAGPGGIYICDECVELCGEIIEEEGASVYSTELERTSAVAPSKKKKGGTYTSSLSSSRTVYRCSFCSKPQEELIRLIAGPGGVYICNECVQVCFDIIEDDNSATADGVELKFFLLELKEYYQRYSPSTVVTSSEALQEVFLRFLRELEVVLSK